MRETERKIKLSDFALNIKVTLLIIIILTLQELIKDVGHLLQAFLA